MKKIDREFKKGLNLGMPIALGYLPVSFTFGLVAVKGGIPASIAILISMTNLTSAGQFAGANIIIAGGNAIELAITTFIINIRYMLMSLSLSQKIDDEIPMAQRSILAFGITDEIFTVASIEEKHITFSYMMGLVSLPYIGWTLGTILGVATCSVLPSNLMNAMGIALYGMFIAIVIPVSKESKNVFMVVIFAMAVSAILYWTPVLCKISSGWRIIIGTIIVCTIGAVLFPKEDK